MTANVVTGVVMEPVKRQRLEAQGWKVGTVEELLGLSPSEAKFIELKLSLSRLLKHLRLSKNLTQEDVAKLVQSSQSRVAKMEAGEASTSIDILIRTLIFIGATPEDIATAISAKN